MRNRERKVVLIKGVPHERVGQTNLYRPTQQSRTNPEYIDRRDFVRTGAIFAVAVALGGGLIKFLSTLEEEAGGDNSTTQTNPTPLEQEPDSTNTNSVPDVVVPDKETRFPPDGYGRVELPAPISGVEYFRKLTSVYNEEKFHTHVLFVDLNQARVRLSVTSTKSGNLKRITLPEYLTGPGCVVNGEPYLNMLGNETDTAYPLVINNQLVTMGFQQIVHNPKPNTPQRSPEQLLMLVTSDNLTEIIPFNMGMLHNPTKYYNEPVDIMTLEKPDAPGRNNRGTVNRSMIGARGGHLVFMLNERMTANKAYSEMEKWRVTDFGKCGGGNDTQGYCSDNDYITSVTEATGIRKIPQAVVISPKEN